MSKRLSLPVCIYTSLVFVLSFTSALLSLTANIGIQYDYPESDLLKSGFKKCYDAPYSESIMLDNGALFPECQHGSTSLFVGAKQYPDAQNISMGAYVSSKILTSFSNHTTRPNVYDSIHNLYWYNIIDHGFGFSLEKTISVDNDYLCDDLDAFDGLCNSKLCWNIGSSEGGFRAGCHVDLWNDNHWRKIIYQYTRKLYNIYIYLKYKLYYIYIYMQNYLIYVFTYIRY